MRIESLPILFPWAKQPDMYPPANAYTAILYMTKPPKSRASPKVAHSKGFPIPAELPLVEDAVALPVAVPLAPLEPLALLPELPEVPDAVVLVADWPKVPPWIAAGEMVEAFLAPATYCWRVFAPVLVKRCQCL